MNEGEFKFPEWQAPLQELILEFDRDKWAEKMKELEIRILERLQQLTQQKSDASEQDALFDGLSILRIINRDRVRPPAKTG